MTEWIQHNPALTAAVLLFLGGVIAQGIKPLLSLIGVRFFGLNKRQRFVTHEELTECLAPFKAALEEIKAELVQGSVCFQGLDTTARTLADVAHGLCQAVQPLVDMDLGCDDLKKIIRGGKSGP